ncbi:MAG: hypothetical protein HZB16_11380 [Armatimonadetes bacterium]|nr:hypothetical protein [Armatimonadota bacterium]
MGTRRVIAGIAGLAVLFIVATALEAAAGQPRPYLVRLTLAGGKLVDQADYCKFDKNQGYYLIATGDCDGASVDLVLTPDPTPYGWGGDTTDGGRPPTPASLPRLRTGTGVNIGESPKQVLAKLGAKPESNTYDKKTRVREMCFYAKVKVRSMGRDYTRYGATYTFRDEKLWKIGYGIGTEDGCGE